MFKRSPVCCNQPSRQSLLYLFWSKFNNWNVFFFNVRDAWQLTSNPSRVTRVPRSPPLARKRKKKNCTCSTGYILRVSCKPKAGASDHMLYLPGSALTETTVTKLSRITQECCGTTLITTAGRKAKSKLQSGGLFV